MANELQDRLTAQLGYEVHASPQHPSPGCHGNKIERGLGLPEGVKESVVKVGIVHGNYPASDLAMAARSYVLL